LDIYTGAAGAKQRNDILSGKEKKMKGHNNPQRSTVVSGMDARMAAMVLTLCILGPLCPSGGYASQLYFDRSEFLSALTGTVVIDFEDQLIGPVAGNPWISYGIAFDQSGTGDNMAIGGGGGGANKNIYALGGESADIDITFPGALMAFGLDVFSNQQHRRNEEIVFYDMYGSVLTNMEMPMTTLRGTAFVGYVADAPMISRVAFIEGNGDGDYAGIGDVVFVIPEPGTLLLLTLGGLAVIRRQRV
jgi:hypothetical protein